MEETTLGTVTQAERTVGPTAECDLVMKGGITSGIVYPKAVLALKDTYRFRNIGGTSAGAIAAAATAAAEYARDARDADGRDGFDRLADLNAALCAEGALRSLFRPSPKTRALMEVASAAMKGRPAATTPVTVAGRAVRVDAKPPRVAAKVGRVAWALARWAPGPVLLGAGAGAGVGAGLSALDAGAATGWRRGLFLGLYGLLGAGVGGGWALLRQLFADVPENRFGLCVGHDKAWEAQGRPGVSPELTDWLSARIEGIAAKADGTPLTFGDLRGRGITLKMMTTNLSEEMPYALPFEDHRFLFQESEMRDYFPGPLVDHLVTKAHRSRRGVRPPPGCHFFPAPDDMPVMVAMRMSLSFPLLISAVPLWSLGARAFRRVHAGQPLGPTDLDRNWFSDGGLSSNFPIHFFDNWLPTRPTFGIDLTAYPPETFDDGGNVREDSLTAMPEAPPPAVFLPRANEKVPVVVNAVTTLPGFLGSIFSTMQNYRDNQQAQLPSYRDRIVQVRLAATEGGLNLDMPGPVLEQVAEKGSEAGRALKEFRLDLHQWTRFRVVMHQLEEELHQMQVRFGGRFDVGALLEAQARSGSGFPYRMTDTARARRVVEQLRVLMDEWAVMEQETPAGGPFAPVFDRDSPSPPSNLRIMPQAYKTQPDEPR